MDDLRPLIAKHRLELLEQQAYYLQVARDIEAAVNIGWCEGLTVVTGAAAVSASVAIGSSSLTGAAGTKLAQTGFGQAVLRQGDKVAVFFRDGKFFQLVWRSKGRPPKLPPGVAEGFGVASVGLGVLADPVGACKAYLLGEAKSARAKAAAIGRTLTALVTKRKTQGRADGARASHEIAKAEALRLKPVGAWASPAVLALEAIADNDSRVARLMQAFAISVERSLAAEAAGRGKGAAAQRAAARKYATELARRLGLSRGLERRVAAAATPQGTPSATIELVSRYRPRTLAEVLAAGVLHKKDASAARIFARLAQQLDP